MTWTDTPMSARKWERKAHLLEIFLWHLALYLCKNRLSLRFCRFFEMCQSFRCTQLLVWYSFQQIYPLTQIFYLWVPSSSKFSFKASSSPHWSVKAWWMRLTLRCHQSQMERKDCPMTSFWSAPRCILINGSNSHKNTFEWPRRYSWIKKAQILGKMIWHLLCNTSLRLLISIYWQILVFSK